MESSPQLVMPLALLLVLLLGLALPVAAGTQAFTIEEPLNREWNNELLHFPFQAPNGQCVAESLRLTGPDGKAVPVQLSEVQTWPNTAFVKSATLSFVLEKLPPQATQVYTAQFAGSAAGLPAPPPAGVTVTQGDGTVELTTSAFGARLLLGESAYPVPRPNTAVPGPLAALRLANGAWVGGSQLYGRTAVKGWTSTLLATGPVFARVKTVFTYANDATVTLISELHAGSPALLLDMTVSNDLPDDGWDLRFDGATVTGGTKISGARVYAKELPITLNAQSTDPACYLCPWPSDGWFPDSPAALSLALGNHPGALYLTTRDTGAWVEPDRAAPWINFANWGDGMPPQMWDGWMRKRLPLLTDARGPFLRVSLAKGQRKWAVAHRTDGLRLLDAMQCKVTGAHTVMLPTFNEVKGLALDWKDGQPHPYLYLSSREIASAGAYHAAALKNLQDVAQMRALLDSLGNMDLMRAVMDTAARYDALIDSGQFTPRERKLLKAQMAFLCYQVANPAHWCYERGIASGNPNMTVSRYANLCVAALAIRENPQAKAWITYTTDWAKFWLKDVVDDTGYWPESSHYARVSWSDYVQMALVLRKAGVYDFFADPKFQQMALFYEKTLTPPDPLRTVYAPVPQGVQSIHPRVGAPYGRGTRGDAWGLSGLLARATATSDPAFSRVMQWSWEQSGRSVTVSHATAGMSDLYVNRDLPTATPDWRSEVFPHLGCLFRSHVGTPEENYLLFVSQYHRNADGEIWPGDTGTIAKWFANGTPIGGNFHRIPDISHPMMVNRVLLATNWDPAKGTQPDSWYTSKVEMQSDALQARADYADVAYTVTAVKPYHAFMPKDAPAFPTREKAGAPPLRWRRQVLLVKDDLPGGPTYLVLRDTVRGNTPTQWHFWTLSEKLGTPGEAADRDVFLRDKPGAKVAPLRELRGDRFTAAGQFDQDVEYYIASPTGTPRYTLRYGYTTGSYGNAGNAAEYQDLLQLQLPGDGAYFVALVPRARGAAAPAFTTLGGGTVIRIAGAFGTDYAFLSVNASRVKADDAAFAGNAGSVQDRANGLTLTLAAAGSVSYKDYSVAAPFALTMRVAPYALSVSAPVGTPGGVVTLDAAGVWALAEPQEGVSLAQAHRGYQLTLPTGATEVRLVKKAVR